MNTEPTVETNPEPNPPHDGHDHDDRRGHRGWHHHGPHGEHRRARHAGRRARMMARRRRAWERMPLDVLEQRQRDLEQAVADLAEVIRRRRPEVGAEPSVDSI